MNMNIVKAKFSLGRIVHTPLAAEKLSQAEMSELLQRHSTGDWGDMVKDDKRSNDDALIEGERLFSSYNTVHGKIWVITEWDRSVTTILLPEEY